ATDSPCLAAVTAPVPTSFAPSWLQTPPIRVYAHAAPAALLSAFPPTRAVLPSADTETEIPWFAAPTAPLPTSLGPCRASCACAQRAVIKNASIVTRTTGQPAAKRCDRMLASPGGSSGFQLPPRPPRDRSRNAAAGLFRTSESSSVRWCSDSYPGPQAVA